MGERGSDLEKYREGQFSDSFSDGTETDPEKLKKATARLRDKRRGKDLEGRINIPEIKPGKKES